MPERDSSHDPARNPDKQSFSLSPPPSPVEQSVMGEGSNSDTKQSQAEAKELAREIHWVEKATLWSQIGLGIIGVFALVVYHGQLAVMQGQLNEMRSSSRDATNQANRIIDNMNWLAKEMHNSVEESRSSIQSSRSQTQAAIRASQEQNRPWIKVVNVRTRDFKGHSIWFAQISSGGVNDDELFFFGDLEIRNIGRSVSTNTSIGYKVVLSTDQQMDDRQYMLKEQHRFCSSFLSGAIEPINAPVLVFPDEQYVTPIGQGGEGTPVKTSQRPGHNIRSIAVVGCVNYQSTFSRMIYQSGFVYFIANTEDEFGKGPFLIGKNLPVNALRLYRLEAADYAK